ncbi:MAG: ABC transporter permease subunit [Planctomycetes bacterium]|nr:ABC transporter permease subunit [Planctomycetota bacterium]
MNRIWTVAGREFRGYFNSWLAYIFVVLFVSVSMVAFFYVGEFFGTGRADVSPFFRSLPLTLLFLVPGLTMRQWARENEMGSLEILMTLPAQTWELVTGKFLGTMGLVGVSLLFTIGIPITAATLGELDWGPVIGGYAAGLLLAGAYVAIGLFVSSWFADQFLALVGGAVVCGLFGLLSWPVVMDWAAGLPEFLRDSSRFLGFWSRFDAIQRGVLDLRDILFYLTVTILFLFLNVCRLRLRRLA